MTNRWATMARDEFDFGLAVDLMRKDLGLAFDEARGNGATLPVTALVDQFLADVQGLGGGRQDPQRADPEAGEAGLGFGVSGMGWKADGRLLRQTVQSPPRPAPLLSRRHADCAVEPGCTGR